MAYEWKFKQRPYTDEEAKDLLKNVVSPETTDWHYNTHHKGYVTALNNIEKGLETADRAAANGNYSQIGELKRRFTGIIPVHYFTIYIGKYLVVMAILIRDLK